MKTLLVLLLLIPSLSWGKEYKAFEIEINNNSGKMYETKDWLVTTITRGLGSVGIPKIIKIGDSITVKDVTLNVNFIFVTEWDEDVGALASKGDIWCMVLENEKHHPSYGSSNNKKWINIENCKPINY